MLAKEHTTAWRNMITKCIEQAHDEPFDFLHDGFRYLWIDIAEGLGCRYPR